MDRKKANRHVGSGFEDFLREEGTLQSSTARAIKRVLAWQLQKAMKQSGVSQAAMQKRLRV
jgi:hypothetical protein